MIKLRNCVTFLSNATKIDRPSQVLKPIFYGEIAHFAEFQILRIKKTFSELQKLSAELNLILHQSKKHNQSK